MARQLVGYVFSGLSVPDAYLNISDIQILFTEKSAQISVSIYANEQMRRSGQPSLQGLAYDFKGDLFDQAFGGAIGEDASGTIPAIADDALRATAYQALLAVHPDSMQLLAGSTAV